MLSNKWAFSSAGLVVILAPVFIVHLAMTSGTRL